jgi:YD repeat-containing protein
MINFLLVASCATAPNRCFLPHKSLFTGFKGSLMIVRLLAFWALFVVCASHAAAQSYDYDERGRLERVTYSDCSTIRYFYDASGNRTERIVLAGDGSCAGNQAPVAADDVISMEPGATGLFDLLAVHGSGSADDDPDDDDIRIVSVSQGTMPQTPSGELGVQLQDDRRQVQITAPSTEGAYAFSYEIEDVLGLTDQAQVQLTVQTGGGNGGSPTNSPPVFTSEEAVSVEEGATDAFYIAVAQDSDGDQLLFQDLSGPNAAAFVFNKANGELSLGSNTGPGIYHIELGVSDEIAPVVTLDITVTVNQAQPQNQAPDPNTVAQTGLTRTNEMWVAIPLTGIDADYDAVSLVGLTSVSNGSPGNISTSATGSHGGSAQLHGSHDHIVRVWASAPKGQWEEFLYWVSDGVNPPQSALLRVRVDNRPPVAYSNRYDFYPGETRTLRDITLNDEDEDGDTLTIGRVDNFSAGGSGFVVDPERTEVEYTAPSQVGPAQFGAVIQDPTGGYNFQWVYINVIAPPPPNTCPVARDDSEEVASGSTEDFSLLANDYDVDQGDELSLVSIGTVSGGGSITHLGGGQVRFSAPVGPAVSTFTYDITDGECQRRATVTVTTNQPANRAPTPVDDWPFAISGIARSINVLANDGDPDGDTPLYLHSVTNGSAGGTARIVSGQVEITPGTARNETFTYTVRDRASGGLQGTATIHATVNRHPNLQSETYTLSPGETRTLNVLTNDSDPDTPFGGQQIKIYAVTGVNGGATASQASDGQSISYTAPTAAGTYQFTYWVTDQTGGVSNIRSYVTVVAPNQFPTTSPDYFTLQPGETRVLYGILSNDSDPDGDPLTIERVYEFQGGGSGSVNADRTSVTYTAPLTPGSARFAYVAIDGRGGYRFNWVNITVLPPIDTCGDGIILCP